METNLKYINQICVDLGGTGGHILNVRGENEICMLLGGTGGHSLEINALNEICTIQGVTAGHSLVLNALNAIAGVTKVTNLEAWKYIQSGSMLNPFPVPSLQSFASDLTVIEVEGSYYFKALKGENILITGYDFPAGWVKGFPYKSAATIDIFGQTAVPVVSLFQNFDYGNQYFTKHEAQVVDGNGVETYAPRVSAIVAYSEALTGDDLTDANTYFGVPAIDATAKWIDPVNGNDTTGNGSQAQPYKTHSKVNGLTLTEGILVYVKSGAILRFAWSKNYQLKTIGKVQLTNTTGRAIDYDPSGTVAQTLDGYIVESDDIAGTINFNGNPTGHTLTLKKFYTKESSSVHIQSATYRSNQLFEIRESILNGDDYATLIEKNTDIIDSLLNGSAIATIWSVSNGGAATIRVINSIIRASKLAFKCKYERNLTVLGSSVIAESFITNDSLWVGNIVLKGSTFTRITSISTSYMDFEGIRATSIDIQDCTFNTNSKGLIQLGHCPSVIFKNNIINTPGEGNGIGVSLLYPQTEMDVIFNIENNFININETSGTIIIGEGVNNVGRCGGAIQKNKLYCSTPNDNNHAVWLFSQNAGVQNRFNRLVGMSSMGIRDEIGADYTGSHLYSNILVNTAISSKGCDKLTLSNNTIIYTKYITGVSAIVVISTQSGFGCDENVIKNNIIIYLGTTQIYMVRNDKSTNIFDNNLYYCPHIEWRALQNTTTDKTFAQWQAEGNDIHGKVLSDAEFLGLFTDFANGDYSLKAGSSAIGAGEDLGAAIDDGLDSSTQWNGDSSPTLPAVVTKQQSATWDCGAYIH